MSSCAWRMNAFTTRMPVTFSCTRVFEPGELCAYLVRGGPHARSQPDGRDEQPRRGERGQQRELPVQHGQKNRGPDEEKDAACALQQPLRQQAADHFDVVGHPGHELAGTGRVEEAEGLRLDVIVQALLQVTLCALAVHLHGVVAQKDEAGPQHVCHDQACNEGDKERGARSERSLFHGRDEDIIHNALGDGGRDQGNGHHENGKSYGKHGPAEVRPRGTEKPSKRCHY